MKMKIFSIVCAGVFISLLTASVHSTFLLAGGSDVLDVNVIPRPTSQGVTLVLFLAFSLILVVSGSKLNGRVLFSSFAILFVFLLFVFINGHTFTISGKKHAMLDKWHHLTLQKLPFNPNGSFESMYYRDTPFGIIVENGDSEIFILTFPGYAGTEKNKVVKVIEGFGVKKK